MITDEDITKRQEAYCKILSELVQLTPIVKVRPLINDVYDPIREYRSEKFCHDKFYEVDNGIISFSKFERDLRSRYGDHTIDTMEIIMRKAGE